MNMNVNPVGFGAKLPVSRIKMARNIHNAELPVDNYVKEMLHEHGHEIEGLANFVGSDVVLAQRGNTLLVNSGVKTTAIEMNKMKNGYELIQGIKDNIIENSAIKK